MISRRSELEDVSSMASARILVVLLGLAALCARHVSSSPAAIRPLTCINKQTNQSGVCMFTMDCARINGVALGVCGDRFYFGSCCVVPSLEDELKELEEIEKPLVQRKYIGANQLLAAKQRKQRSTDDQESDAADF